MRHGDHNRKFGREAPQRRALLRSLARSLAVEGAIVTTEAKAREIRPFIEKLITIGKKGGVSSLRLLTARLGGKFGVKALSERAKNDFAKRSGGYTRIFKLGRRTSDGSAMAKIEFVK
ncbi:MAG: 50S ribosomal protein L17 [Candidatus Taylorbacteria bacterium RIFCSPLOWO2_12_FULL_47_20]|uniref:50S ribosomal protein L17 n=2 Tax=Candidatus Tayloriibacteriota TaxID=1817919 RepID=A0A1G2PAI8_9BACT|nr:MAG: 50S ribosomal protein L17 [Candidatus Taylorbacteria bacterium RIFCSPLOWO2_02_FULL_46_40]OHA45330.1 MAG: 50S ribosomal protein L17 [Candidatus Taylorbacteria bacterium RIFCSPLOWO2_12_FULL_47_20]